ncbi:MAG: hypothetical protein MUF50_01560 [Planctomycetes bacterium]|nr:hypothetical protein [Planctomycetota bacterium]
MKKIFFTPVFVLLIVFGHLNKTMCTESIDTNNFVKIFDFSALSQYGRTTFIINKTKKLKETFIGYDRIAILNTIMPIYEKGELGVTRKEINFVILKFKFKSFSIKNNYYQDALQAVADFQSITKILQENEIKVKIKKNNQIKRKDYLNLQIPQDINNDTVIIQLVNIESSLQMIAINNPNIIYQSDLAGDIGFITSLDKDSVKQSIIVNTGNDTYGTTFAELFHVLADKYKIEGENHMRLFICC